MQASSTISNTHIILPVFNRRETTLQCIKQLYEQTQPPEFIVVSDGGSKDGTVEAIRKEFPSVTVLETTDNLYWGESVARGIEFVMSLSPSDNDVIIMMNDDNLLAPNLVGVLSSFCRDQKAAVSAIVLNVDNLGEVLDGGVRLYWTPYRYVASRQMPENKQLYTEVDVLNGRSTAFLCEMIRKVGNVDASTFPHYIADYDFAQRIKKSGYKLFVTSSTWIATSKRPSGIHFSSAPRGLKGLAELAFSRRSRVNIKNHINFVFRHAPDFLSATRAAKSFVRSFINNAWNR